MEPVQHALLWCNVVCDIRVLLSISLLHLHPPRILTDAVSARVSPSFVNRTPYLAASDLPTLILARRVLMRQKTDLAPVSLSQLSSVSLLSADDSLGYHVCIRNDFGFAAPALP